MIGVLNIDKPAGMTSHDVVDHVRKASGIKRVGHAGTLDPFATGVLVVALGPATRLIQFSHDWDKEYEATIVLGATSDTDDITGKISKSETLNSKQIQKEEILNVLQQFVGEIEQVPPAYAAVKVGGEKLYEKARRGELVEVEPRTVTIHKIELVRYEWPFDEAQGKPELEIHVRCGTGTYIRALARDAGEALGVGGYVSQLRRTRVGKLMVNQAIQLDQLNPDTFVDYLLPPASLVNHLQQITLTHDDATKFQQGTQLSEISGPASSANQLNELVAVLDQSKELLGVGEIEGTELSPRVVLPR